ncbi:MAG: M43 family zinc metalloprotease [Chitinophagaceae bacterium]
MKLFLLATFCLSMSIAMAQRTCVSQQYYEQELRTDPELAKKLAAIEKAIQQSKETTTTGTSGSTAGMQVITIPVVVHVLYNSPALNLTDAQIQSQIEVLNRDFRKLNTDTINTPLVFKSRAADCFIEFKLAKVDPRGRATSGIVRKSTSIQFFGLDDRIKSSAIGGDDTWDPDRYMNIWVGSLAGSLLGYASVVGGPKEKDGVVISYRAFGTSGTASYPYDKGRTATHEVGHWLGLRHIWGDQYCGNDYVDDTPPQQTSTYGCPQGVVSSCGNTSTGNMYMNYMDLTYDACINLFTLGQREKMRDLFVTGGPRNALLRSDACTATPTAAPEETGLPEEQGTGDVIRMYPVPAATNVNISVNNAYNLSGKYVTLYNRLGQPVAKTLITKGVTVLNVQSLPEGLYFARVEGQQKTYRVLKVSE